jgi:hypothetical protein
MRRQFELLSGDHKVQRLRLGGAVEDCSLKLPKLTSQQLFHSPAELKTESAYGIPKSRTFAAVDAVIRPQFALQMTVSEDHGFKLDGLKSVKAALALGSADPLHVVLVCPPDVVATGKVKWQPLKRGKQTVLKPQGLVDGIGLFQYLLAFDWT